MYREQKPFSAFLKELGMCRFNMLRALNHLPLGISVLQLQERMPLEGCQYHTIETLSSELDYLVKLGYVKKEDEKYMPIQPISDFLDGIEAGWDQTFSMIKEQRSTQSPLQSLT